MRLLFHCALLLNLLLWIAGCSTGPTAPPPLERPEQLANPLASFSLRLWTDHSPWLLDSLVDLKLSASAPVYLSLYAIHSSGRTSRLLADRQVLANRTLLYPEPHVPLDLRLSPPVGTEVFILVGTQIPLNWPPTRQAPGAERPPVEPLGLGQQGLLDGLQLSLWERDQRQWNATVLRVPLEARIALND